MPVHKYIYKSFRKSEILKTTSTQLLLVNYLTAITSYVWKLSYNYIYKKQFVICKSEKTLYVTQFVCRRLNCSKKYAIKYPIRMAMYVQENHIIVFTLIASQNAQNSVS